MTTQAQRLWQTLIQPNAPYIAAFLFAGVVMLLILALYRYLQVRTAAMWPRARGRITRSNIVRNERFIQGRKIVEFYVDAIYEYVVDGMSYTGDCISYRPNRSVAFMSQEKAQAVASRYPVGQHVEVYYNRSNPPDAFLDTEYSAGAWSGHLMVSILIIAGAFLLLIAAR